MWPTFVIFGIPIPTINLLVAAGLFAGLFTLLLAVRRKRLPLDFIADNILVLLVALFVVGRVGEMIWYQYPLLSLPFFWRDTGFDFQSGVLGFVVVLAVLAYRQRQALLPWLDALALAASMSLVWLHAGALFAGSMYGVPTTLPWGVVYSHPDAATLTTLPVHPTQAYALIITLVLFVSAALLFKQTRTAGKTAAFLCFLLPFSYFLIDFLRDDSSPSFLDMRVSQYLWLLYAVLGLCIALKLRMRGGHDTEFTLSHTSHD